MMTSSGVPHDSETADWRHSLPVLRGRGVVLRELRASDAASLCAALTVEDVTRFLSPPPKTVQGFEKFIDWVIAQRTAGKCMCFAITLAPTDVAVGLFQVRQLEPTFTTAEWGFAVAAPLWGTGVFEAGARLLLDFVFGTLGTQRLEARAAVRNGRGNGALLKVGATREGTLRRSLKCRGEYVDQALYALLDAEWYARRSTRAPSFAIH
jgi:RimJ/RimL family protein N-acetyltransferase